MTSPSDVSADDVVDEQDYDTLDSVPRVSPDRPGPADWEAVAELDLEGAPIKACGCGPTLCAQHAQIAPRRAPSRTVRRLW